MAIIAQRRPAPPAEKHAPDMPDWGAAGWAGLAAGLVFMAVELAGSALTGAAWMPSRLIAAVVLGGGILAPRPEYNGVINAAAFGVHMTLSLFFARLLALIFYRQKLSFAVEEGVAFGAALYALNFYALPLMFPFVADGRGMATFLSHLAWGACVPVFYRRITTSRPWRRFTAPRGTAASGPRD